MNQLFGHSQALLCLLAAFLLLATACGGEQGTEENPCTVVDNGDGTYVLQCEDGTEFTITDDTADSDGNFCSVEDNEDGTYTLSCEDGTEVTLSDGDGGSSCAVQDNQDGTYTLRCEDGTEVTFSDADGDDEDNDGEAPGFCSVDDHADGTYTLSCEDHAEVVTSNGDDKSLCNLEDNEDGTYTLSCEDGTQVVLDEWVEGADANTCALVEGEGDTFRLICEEDDDIGESGEIFVDPQWINFPPTPPDSNTWRVVEIHNIGADPLHFGDFDLAGEDPAYFSYSFISGRNPDGSFPPESQDSNVAPTTLDPGDDPLYMRVFFSPDDELPRNAQIQIESSDQDITVELAGNSDAPCLEVVQGDTLDFGPASIDDTTYRMVTLRNCSPQAQLEISDIDLSDDAGGVYTLPADAPLDLPYEMAPGQVAQTMVGFSPDDEVQYSGELYIESDDGVTPERYISISGSGVDAQCPVALATGNVGSPGEGSEVVSASNQDIVYLSSEGSHDPDDTDLSYEWSVIAHPEGSFADVQPSPFEPNPSFEVDIVGQFQIELVVYDETGLRNCDPAIVEIDATPDGNIHIQLTWSAPKVDATYGGPNGSQGIGTDLDIHYVNSHDGIDQWGSTTSIYWLRPSQNWPEHGEARLDIDDLYGEGPENITHTDPGQDGMYRVGVHYFSDNGWEAADATVRIYLGGTFYGEWTRRLMQTDNFWYVGNVIWADNPYVDFVDELDETHALSSASG